MIRAIQHNNARSYEWTMVALETRVESKVHVLCLQEKPRERRGVGNSHWVYEIRNRKRVWTAIGKGSGLVVDERTDSSRGANDNIIVTDIRRRGQRITRIVQNDDQRDTQSGERRA
jgi:hypothetical protein